MLLFSLLGLNELFTDVSLNASKIFDFFLQESFYNHYLSLRISQSWFRAIEKCLMHIKYIKNRLKTSRYAARPEWNISWGIPLALGRPIGYPNRPDRKFSFLFWYQNLRGHPKWVIPITWVIPGESLTIYHKLK